MYFSPIIEGYVKFEGIDTEYPGWSPELALAAVVDSRWLFTLQGARAAGQALVEEWATAHQIGVGHVIQVLDDLSRFVEGLVEGMPSREEWLAWSYQAAVVRALDYNVLFPKKWASPRELKKRRVRLLAMAASKSLGLRLQEKEKVRVEIRPAAGIRAFVPAEPERGWVSFSTAAHRWVEGGPAPPLRFGRVWHER